MIRNCRPCGPLKCARHPLHMPIAMNKLCQPKWSSFLLPLSSKEPSRPAIATLSGHSTYSPSTSPTPEESTSSVLDAAARSSRSSCQCCMQRVRNAQDTRPSYLGPLAGLAPRTVVLQAQQPLGHLVARGGREVVGPLACLDPNGERPVRLGPRLGAAPREVQRAGPVWKSTSELGYPEKHCGDLRDPSRRRAAAPTGTRSRRWRRISTPSSRCSYGDDVVSMVWGVRNL